MCKIRHPLPLVLERVPSGTIQDGSIAEIIQLIVNYQCAKFDASSLKDVAILLQSLNSTHPPPMGQECVPPGRIPDGSLAAIDQLIEYYHDAKFGASNLKDEIFISLFIYVKKGRKFATAEEVLVTKGETLVANATNTVSMLSPAVVYCFFDNTYSHNFFPSRKKKKEAF